MQIDRWMRVMIRNNGLRLIRLAMAFAALGVTPGAAASASVPEVGAPELAGLGGSAVGVMTRAVVVSTMVDGVASIAAKRVVRVVRTLPLTIWYPARAVARSVGVTYSASLSGEAPRAAVRFSVPGIAVAGAPAAGERHPLVLISHGYENDPAMMSWLGENLASKGYVVVAISHRDPPISERDKVPAALVQRPLDIVAVLARIRGGLLGSMADVARIGLVGYSMGGYGVLTTAGARIDPASPAMHALPTDLAARYAGDGPDAAALHDAGVQAVIAISPAGGAPWQVWGSGIARVRVPMMMIAGSLDRTVGYEAGPHALFERATGSDRYFLTFVGAGHSIGVNPAPPEMRARLWDYDWFEDPVWRKARVNAVATHFITAFLDWHLKGDAAKASYLVVPAEGSDSPAWVGEDQAYDAISQGGANPTWKGFARNHQNGLELRHRAAVP